MTGRRLDHIGLFQVGVLIDVGWGFAVLNADDTVTRTCKGCGVSVTTSFDRATGVVAEAVIHHRKDCRIGLIGNNAALS